RRLDHRSGPRRRRRRRRDRRQRHARGCGESRPQLYRPLSQAAAEVRAGREEAESGGVTLKHSQSEEWRHPKAEGEAYLCSFPFFILTREDEQLLPIMRALPSGLQIRLYPPFTSATGGFRWTPPI